MREIKMENSNREIKFRAWDNNKMIIQDFDIEDLMQGFSVFDKDFIWMQYTGLKDIQKKEIYEGDILGIELQKCNDKGRQTSQVIFDLGGFAISIINCKIYKRGSINYFAKYADQFKIIGNIYENPELLT